MGKNMFHASIYVSGTTLERRKTLSGCPKNSIEYVSFWQKNQYVPGSLLCFSMGLEWQIVCSNHQFMYVEPHLYEKILLGCPKNAIEFMPFWLKNQYSPGSLLRHPVSFCGIGMGKIFSIHIFMYVEPVNTFSSTTIDRLLENI